MEDDCFINIERKFNFTFRDKQKLALQSIIERHDTFIVLPTGYGKSKIYSHLPEIYEHMYSSKATVLVISPLQALMIDQVNKLNTLGISAIFVGESQHDKSVAEKIASGHFSIVFCSPEAALIPGIWRRSITNGVFQDNLKAVVIDEAHCITQWGGEFRLEYGKLGELRSVVPEGTIFVTLTATATKSMQKDIMKKLDMDIETTSVISIQPDRPNVAYFVKKSSKNRQELQWLITDLLHHGRNTKKTIVYCRNIINCANLYEHFKLAIDDSSEGPDDRILGMFHRSTAEANKEHILTEFPKFNSSVRVVFATIAFGMGIDIPDIERVVHWGGPRGLEQYSQESGRAGRDGRLAISCIYYSGYDIAKGSCSEEVRQFFKSNECLRHSLGNYFNLDNCESQITQQCSPLCRCCSICKLKCDCGNCTDHEFLDLKVDETDMLFDDDEIRRNLTSDQLTLLRDNLIDYRECLKEEEDDYYLTLDDKLIESIVSNSVYLLCEDDIISLGLVNHRYAADLLTLIEEVENC